MDLALDPTRAEGYSSKAQRSRVITEAWAAEHLYCLNCDGERVEAHRPNKRVEDFRCPSCDRRIQLKASRGGHGRKVSNSAYEPKIDGIRANRAPDYAFMGFDPGDWLVNNLFVVPGHFITPTVVEERKPLSATARRSGWVGSNILLDRIPDAGRIALVDYGDVVPRDMARERFEQTAFLDCESAAARDWTSAVMDLSTSSTSGQGKHSTWLPCTRSRTDCRSCTPTTSTSGRRSDSSSRCSGTRG